MDRCADCLFVGDCCALFETARRQESERDALELERSVEYLGRLGYPRRLVEGELKR